MIFDRLAQKYSCKIATYSTTRTRIDLPASANAPILGVVYVKRLAISAVAAALSATTTYAADLPRRAVPPAPVAAPLPTFTWSGLYAGVNAGFAQGRDTLKDLGSSDVASALGADKINLKDQGFAGGGQVGYNYQLTPGNGVVVGVEGDAQYVALHRKRSVQSNPEIPTDGLSGLGFTDRDKFTAESTTNGLYTIRGRAGYAFDRFLVYGTGGVAFGDIRTRAVYTTEELTYHDQVLVGTYPESRKAFRLSGIQTGYAAGGGIEYALPQHGDTTNAVTIRVEYLHYDLGHRTINVDSVTKPKATAQGDLVRAGLNYKFNGL